MYVCICTYVYAYIYIYREREREREREMVPRASDQRRPTAFPRDRTLEFYAHYNIVL